MEVRLAREWTAGMSAVAALLFFACTVADRPGSSKDAADTDGGPDASRGAVGVGGAGGFRSTASGGLATGAHAGGVAGSPAVSSGGTSEAGADTSAGADTNDARVPVVPTDAADASSTLDGAIDAGAPRSCATSANCPLGLVCEGTAFDHRCEEPDGSCRANEDCPYGTYCGWGRCVDAPKAGHPCGPGRTCEASAYCGQAIDHAHRDASGAYLLTGDVECRPRGRDCTPTSTYYTCEDGTTCGADEGGQDWSCWPGRTREDGWLPSPVHCGWRGCAVVTDWCLPRDPNNLIDDFWGCVPAVLEGGACYIDRARCRFDLFCDTSSPEAPTCRPPASPGMPCDGGGPPCVPGYRCDSEFQGSGPPWKAGTCVPLPGAGDPCPPFYVEWGCDAYTYCGKDGLCTPRHARGGLCDLGACSAGLVCATVQIGGTCVVPDAG